MKKQKKEVETAVQNAKKGKKTKTIIEAAVKKKVERSSSDDSSSESEQVSCVFLCINRIWNDSFFKKNLRSFPFCSLFLTLKILYAD